ncbi:hypothetical protein EON66_05040, partial [archaeon]
MAPGLKYHERARARAAAAWMVALSVLLCCHVAPTAAAHKYTAASYPDLNVRVKQLVADAKVPPASNTQGECVVDERCGHGHGAFTRLCDPDRVLSYPGAMHASYVLDLIE